MKRVQCRTHAGVMQPCEEPSRLPDLLWFACCAREVKTDKGAFSATAHRAIAQSKERKELSWTVTVAIVIFQRVAQNKHQTKQSREIS